MHRDCIGTSDRDRGPGTFLKTNETNTPLDFESRGGYYSLFGFGGFSSVRRAETAKTESSQTIARQNGDFNG